MMDVLLTIAALLVALSLLIAVHELGHFLVARWVGVKVLRYSIGFGKPLWQKRSGADQTEYVIAAIPLGGYVKMLDEREGEVAEAEQYRAFNRQPLLKRSAIVLAGPFFNFVFAILAYWLMFVIGINGIKPIIGEIESDTIAASAGLHSGQEILAVDGEQTPTWQSAIEAILPKMLLKQPVKLVVYEGGVSREAVLEFSDVNSDSKPQELYKQLGLNLYQPRIAPVIGKVVSDSVAEKAGLKSGDRVITAAGQAVDEWQQLVTIIQAHPDMPLTLQVLRDGSELTLTMRPQAQPGENGPIGKIGTGVYFDRSLFEPLRAELRYDAAAAIPAALTKSWDMAALTLKMIGEMIMGRASVENISGPIGIAQYAKQSADAGISHFLKFLGLISVSLGVLNLLPIPVLDGGHLLYYLVEAVIRRPVPERFEAIGQRIGLALILALSSLAIFNDLARLAGGN
jgi:regulator of sigma E protease